MAPTRGTLLLQHLRKLAAAQCASQLADRQLLQQFIADRDEAAFAALVQRHGALVLGVCRSVLHHQQDAEDVFQATFLVLARRAGSIRKQPSLSSWLHGVAFRLATKAKRQADRRRDREQQARQQRPPSHLDDLSWRELRVVLHEELQRLPDKYRAPLLLCYWEGNTRDEAAAQLGWTRGTLKERLERARKLLQRRLTGRGLAPSAALIAALFSESAAQVASCSSLTKTTAQAARAFAGGMEAIGRLPTAPALTLAEGALRAMHRTQWARAFVVVAVLASLGLGLGLVTRQVLQAGQSNAAVATASSGPRQPAQDQQDALVVEGPFRTPPAQAGAKQKDDTAKKNPAGAVDLVKAATVRPGGGENYPVLPVMSTQMRGSVVAEIHNSDAIRQAYEKLDAVKRRNVDWFEGVAELEKQQVVWCLLSCLCHHSPDVQIHALRSLERLGDKRAVPFLLLYAEYMAVLVSGSENATIHGIIHQSVAQTLSALTGVRIAVKGQDPDALRKGLKQWRKWLVDHDKDSP
jgi:RNA polymerase sigma factor (sigma-70 family)